MRLAPNMRMHLPCRHSLTAPCSCGLNGSHPKNISRVCHLVIPVVSLDGQGCRLEHTREYHQASSMYFACWEASQGTPHSMHLVPLPCLPDRPVPEGCVCDLEGDRAGRYRAGLAVLLLSHSGEGRRALKERKRCVYHLPEASTPLFTRHAEPSARDVISILVGNLSGAHACTGQPDDGSRRPGGVRGRAPARSLLRSPARSVAEEVEATARAVTTSGKSNRAYDNARAHRYIGGVEEIGVACDVLRRQLGTHRVSRRGRGVVY